MKPVKNFASDNSSGVHPAVLKAIASANSGHVTAYGNDLYTESAVKKFKKIFGKNIEVFFVFNGTAANVLGLKQVTKPFNSIICAETSHLNHHECGAPESFIGCKLITIPTRNGKLTPKQIEKYMVGFGNEHESQVKVVSITQPSEFGVLYTKKEIKEIAKLTHKYNCYLHVDGARISNAAAAMNSGLKEITKDLGVDILSFGGTKNGLLGGEALIFFNKKLAKDFKYIRKQGMQLASKMRFVAVQFEALLTKKLWLKNASHANKMTKLLASKLKEVPKVKITQKADTNTIFATIPKRFIKPLQKKILFLCMESKNI